jgi:hypothetical protein
MALMVSLIASWWKAGMIRVPPLGTRLVPPACIHSGRLLDVRERPQYPNRVDRAARLLSVAALEIPMACRLQLTISMELGLASAGMRRADS